MPIRPFLRGLLLSAALPALPLGCTGDAFGCLEEQQCGDGGQCESNGYCSFPDPSCESGRRFADNATDGVANVCVPVSSSTGTLGSGSSTDTTTGPPAFTSSTTAGSTGAPSDSSGTDASGTFGANESGGLDSSSTTFEGTSSSGFFGSESTAAGTTACVDQGADDCLDCFICSDEQECSNLSGVCNGIAGCTEVSACLSTCETQGLCFDDCCDGAAPSAIEAAQALNQCHQDTCMSRFCPTFAGATCGGA